MIDSMQMLTVIKSTLEKMGSKYANHDAMMLVYNTGLVESKYSYVMQKGGSNIARGFWQCEPWVAVSMCNDYLQYRGKLLEKCAEISYIDKSYFVKPNEADWKELLTYNIRIGIIFCRLHYWRVPKSLPKSLDSMAGYWKKHYNTSGGSGSEKHFKEIVNKYA